MAQNLKHVGRIKATGRKCLVAFRTLPNDAFNCLIILTESLTPSYHDALINLVESPAAQNAGEFAEVLARAIFPDGSTMLPSLHAKGMLIKVGTDLIEMLPNNQTSILLSELNQAIAEQQGISVQDLAMKDPNQSAEIKNVATINNLDTDTKKDNDTVKTSSASVNEDGSNLALSTNASPEETAKMYRSQADKLSKEAAHYRRLAEELVPTKKKQTVKE